MRRWVFLLRVVSYLFLHVSVTISFVLCHIVDISRVTALLMGSIILLIPIIIAIVAIETTVSEQAGCARNSM